jgi:hypothetical protein
MENFKKIFSVNLVRMTLSSIADFMNQALRHLSQFFQPGLHRSRQWRSLVVIMLVAALWSLLGNLVWGIETTRADQILAQGAVDPVTPSYQLGEELYLENCSSCHIALSPAVLPSQTWREILEDPQTHYGVSLPPMVEPTIVLIWNYLRQYSRPYPDDEPIPVQVNFSRYFNALHPGVDVPRPVQPSTCISCHPGANQYDFRSLAPEWER